MQDFLNANNCWRELSFNQPDSGPDHVFIAFLEDWENNYIILMLSFSNNNVLGASFNRLA